MELPIDRLSGTLPPLVFPTAWGLQPASVMPSVPVDRVGPGVPGATVASDGQSLNGVGRCGLADHGAKTSGYGFIVSVCYGLGPAS